MLKAPLLWVANRRQVYRFVLRHDLLRGFAWRFVAGERLADGLRVATDLNRQGLKASLDHLGENVDSPAAARAAVDEYRALLAALERQDADAYASLKLTQMGLDLDRDLALANVREVLRAAGERSFVRLDMESSAYTTRTLDLHAALWDEGFHNVGVVLQAYLYRTPADLERVNRLGARVRLCKGAYLEPPAVAYPRKADVDAAYARLAETLLLEGTHPAFATHDYRLIQHVQDVARKHRIGPDQFEFQMLYGVRRDLQARLRDQGYAVRVYVPYGTEWYPYLVRRLAERPANLTFFLGSMLRERLAGHRAAAPAASRP